MMSKELYQAAVEHLEQCGNRCEGCEFMKGHNVTDIPGRIILHVDKGFQVIVDCAPRSIVNTWNYLKGK